MHKMHAALVASCCKACHVTNHGCRCCYLCYCYSQLLLLLLVTGYDPYAPFTLTCTKCTPRW
jgi:hypothetical protein